MSRTLVVGDVHACARELEALVRLADADRVVLVGDLFTKGPSPARTWRMILDRDMEAVLGNHDVRLLERLDGGRPGDRHASEVIDALDRVGRGWRKWLARRPLWLDVGRWRVTHAALHPSGEPSRTSRRTHLYLRRWPHDRPEDPRWWKVYEGGPVIFGHDARQGLLTVERDGRPWLVGLDTGCVYGGQLSGWLVEEERLFQVPAARVYRPVS